MSETLADVQTPPITPRIVAVSGIIFSGLFVLSLALIRMVVPADPTDPGEWLADDRFRNLVRLALNLIPFTGITFIWFMAALRNRIGLLEDQFLSTVFLCSGQLFVAMLFASAAVSIATLETFTVPNNLPTQSDTYALARRFGYTLMNPYGIRMAAVFTFATSMIGFRTSVLPRWLAFTGFAVGFVLLLVITEFAWIVLLFPLWVLLVSAYILAADFRQSISCPLGARETIDGECGR